MSLLRHSWNFAIFPGLTLTYCTQGRSGTHFSFLEYRIVIERNREHSCLELKRSTKMKNFWTWTECMRILTTCKCEASYRLNRVPAQGDLFKVTDSLQTGWHQVEQSNFRSNPPWRQMVVLCWFCCGQAWSFSSSSTPWRPENIWLFLSEQFGFWRFSYFRLSGFFPCPGFEMPPHLSSLEPRVPWWRHCQLK